jgi:hypothetical protein
VSKPVSFFVLDWLVFNTDLQQYFSLYAVRKWKKSNFILYNYPSYSRWMHSFQVEHVLQFFLFFLFSISPLKRLLSSYTFCGWTKNVLINFQWGPNWADRGKTYSNKVNLELMFLLIYCLNMNGRECMKIDKLMCKPCWLDLMNEFCVNCLEYQLGKTMQGLLVLIDC